MKLKKPLYDRVLVKVEKEKEVTKGGIILAEGAKQADFLKGEVIKVGDGRIAWDGKLVPPLVKSGDKIIFSKHVGYSIEDGADKMLLIKEEDILSTVE